MDERSIVTCSDYTVGSSYSYVPESLTSIALCRPFEIRWSLPEKRGIDRRLLECLLYKIIEDPVTHEVFTVVLHVQGTHDGQLNFLQPGFLIASLDDRPLHTVIENTNSFQVTSAPGPSQMTQSTRGATGGFDPTMYGTIDRSTVDIIFMKPVARLMSHVGCSIGNDRAQPSIVSSSSFGDTEHSSSIVDRDPLVDLWNSTSSEVMHHIPFCYLTILSALPLDQNPSQSLLDELFLRRELQRLSNPGKSHGSRPSGSSQLNSGNKFFLNVTMDVLGQINWKTLNEPPDFYMRCKATVYARLLRRNTSPMPLEEILLRTPAPPHVLSPLLEANIDRSVDVFVNEASNKSHKFLQLFTALYSILLITFDADNLNEAQVSRIYEYMAKLQYFVSSSNSVPIYFVGLTKKSTGIVSSPDNDDLSTSYPLVKGFVNSSDSAFDVEAFPSDMSDVIIKLNKVLNNLGGTLNVKLCILSDGNEASRRNAINKLRTSILENIVVQKSWGFEDRDSKSRHQAASDKYLVKFLSCRQTIISKAEYQWSRNESACMEIEDFIKFILDHSKLTTRELTTAISYFENSGFIRTITATTNASKGWVLLYPQYVFVVICNLMKQFAPTQPANTEFRQTGLLDSRQWALYFENPLAFVLRPYSIMTYLGLFYFEVSQREERQILMASQFDPNSRRRFSVSQSNKNNNNKSELISKKKKKYKFVNGKNPHLCNNAVDSELFFAINLSGTVSRRTPLELHHLLYSLIVDCSNLFSTSRNSFFAAFCADIMEHIVAYPEELIADFTQQQKLVQLEFQFLGIKSLRNAIVVRASAFSSNFLNEWSSSVSSVRNYERIFGSFLREKALRVLQQLQGNGSEGPGNVAAYLDPSCGIQVEPLCACEKNEFEA